MHPNNPHLNGYDMQALVQVLPELKPFVLKGKSDRLTIDFANDNAVKLLNKALLKHHYGLQDWDIPKGYLCPPIPGRVDYLCHLNDYLKQLGIVVQDKASDAGFYALDVGTGANVIYPLLANRLIGWNMVASDIDDGALENARNVLEANHSLNLSITLRKQKSNQHSFVGIIKPDDFFHVTMCNPPFHESQQAAMLGSERKNKNLNRNKQKRESSLGKINDARQLNFSGQANELWCEGGEKRFITNMMYESRQFANQVACFTCLVSKKETLGPLKRTLKKLEAKFDIIEMQQGNKISRFIAWQFNT